jgi:hypothetical protein
MENQEQKSNIDQPVVSGSLIGKNAILFSRVDKEDYWVSGGLVFKVQNTGTYEDAYNEIKNKLEAPELIAYIIEDRCLLDDLFDNDETFKFVKTYWKFGLYFVFENSEGEEVEERYSAYFVWVA